MVGKVLGCIGMVMRSWHSSGRSFHLSLVSGMSLNFSLKQRESLCACFVCWQEH